MLLDVTQHALVAVAATSVFLTPAAFYALFRDPSHKVRSIVTGFILAAWSAQSVVVTLLFVFN